MARSAAGTASLERAPITMRRIRPTTPAETATPAAQAVAPPVVAARPTSVTFPGRELLADEVGASIVLAAWSGDPITLCPAPPGSGKTTLVVKLGALLSHRAGLRIGIAAQTRAQACDVAKRLAGLEYCQRDRIGLLWKSSGPRPDAGDCPIIDKTRSVWPSDGGAVRIATTAKWLMADPSEYAADLLIVDEAYQCTYADIGALGAMAGQILCVGDAGQIEPVVTGSVARWQDSPTGPHVPGPIALAAAHPKLVTTVPLRHTWRLGPVTAKLVSDAFYPDLPFTSRRPDEHIEVAGRALPELSHRMITAADGPTAASVTDAVVTRVHELLDDTTLVTAQGRRPITGDDVAVVVPHVSQAAAVRATLADVPSVMVGTANALQGMERAVVVAVHPMVGKRIPGQFDLDAGRLCVMLSRHRDHLTVLVDEQSDQVFQLHASPETATGAAILDQITATAEV